MSSLGFLNGKDWEKGRDEGEVHSTWLMHQPPLDFSRKINFSFLRTMLLPQRRGFELPGRPMPKS